MSPAELNQPADAQDSKTVNDGPGKRLREAREQKGLSTRHVADALHLDEAIIVALEQEDFASFGAPVYVRGHIKTYAELLDLPADELAGTISSQLSGPVVADALQRTGRTPATVNPVLLVSAGAAIVIGLILALYVLFAPGDPESSAARPAIVDTPGEEQPAGVADAEDE